MDKEVTNNLTALGFRDVRLYEETGLETYFDGRLPTGEQVEIRCKRSKIHYRLFGIKDASQVKWVEIGTPVRKKKPETATATEVPETPEPPRKDFSLETTDGTKCTQLSLFD